MGDSRSLAAVRPPPLWLGRHGKGPTTPAARKGVPRPGGEGPELRSQIPLRGTGECVGQACRRAADFLRGAPGGGYAKRGRGSRSFLERQKKAGRERPAEEQESTTRQQSCRRARLFSLNFDSLLFLFLAGFALLPPRAAGNPLLPVFRGRKYM